MIKTMERYGLGALLGLVLVAWGAFSGRLIYPSAMEWYHGLSKPWFTPGNGVFAPVWAILYFLMGIASFRTWKEINTYDVKWLVLLQFCFNFAWPWIFFHKRWILLGLIDIGLLCLCLVSIVFLVRKSLELLLLWLPYTLWIMFASLLNAWIVFHNL